MNMHSMGGGLLYVTRQTSGHRTMVPSYELRRILRKKWQRRASNGSFGRLLVEGGGCLMNMKTGLRCGKLRRTGTICEQDAE